MNDQLPTNLFSWSEQGNRYANHRLPSCANEKGMFVSRYIYILLTILQVSYYTTTHNDDGCQHRHQHRRLLPPNHHEMNQSIKHQKRPKKRRRWRPLGHGYIFKISYVTNDISRYYLQRRRDDTAAAASPFNHHNQASNTKKGPRDVNDDVSLAAGMFFYFTNNILDTIYHDGKVERHRVRKRRDNGTAGTEKGEGGDSDDNESTIGTCLWRQRRGQGI